MPITTQALRSARWRELCAVCIVSMIDGRLYNRLTPDPRLRCFCTDLVYKKQNIAFEKYSLIFQFYSRHNSSHFITPNRMRKKYKTGQRRTLRRSRRENVLAREDLKTLPFLSPGVCRLLLTPARCSVSHWVRLRAELLEMMLGFAEGSRLIREGRTGFKDATGTRARNESASCCWRGNDGVTC